MHRIENFRMEPLIDGKFLKTSLARYKQNNIEKSWEVIKAHDSVAILLFNRDKQAFVLVKQFRPAVYINNQNGMSIELCAGLVDKNKTLLQIAKEEIEEECGYEVPLKNISKITSTYGSVGFAGSKQTLYYSEVTNSMKINQGGGVDEEEIEVIYMPLKEVKSFLFDESIAKTTGIMFAFMWWFENRA